MTARPRLHWPTIVGRARTDRGLLALMGLVAALTTALTAAVAPLTDRTADRALAAAVRDAGPDAAVVATLPRGYDDPTGRKREPRSAEELRQDTGYAEFSMPRRLAAVTRPGIATLTTPPLHLLDDGPGRYLRLAYVDTSAGPPAVTYTAGGPPRATVGPGRADTTVPADGPPWPVQVALSEAAAAALGVGPGSSIPAEDEHHRPVRIVISGTFTATAPGADAWRLVPDLRQPTEGVSAGARSTSAAALVSPDSLPDLRVALPADDLVHRVVLAPRPDRLRWRTSAALQRDVVSLQTSAGATRQQISWDSDLDRVVGIGRARVASARGQAQVLVVGLVACALLVLLLAAQLLVRRRAGALSTTRARGASLAGVAAELAVEAAAVAVVATAIGLVSVRVLVGPPGWASVLPVLLVASSAAPLLGAVAAARASDVPRVPANRAVRRAAARAGRLRRLALEGAVLTAAALSLVALRQRGVVGDGGDLTAAGAATWWAVAGALVVLRLVPPAVGLSVRAARRSAGSVRFLVLTRLAQTATRALPLLVVSLAVAQLTVGVALAATEQTGQSAGALLAVGGDARLTAGPSAAVAGLADEVDAAPGVRAAASGRVVDGARVSSARSADTVRLVVVDATAYRRLLTASALPDAPALDRLGTEQGDRVPALLVGGDADLRDGLTVRWEETDVPLDVVGRAPQVEAATGPVVVVDADAFAAAGALARPDTVWAVGPGAARAVEAHAPPSASVVRYADQLDARRRAPLPSALVGLAVASSALLLVFALLGVLLAAAAEAPAREVSLGRLRSLGIPDRDLRRVVAGEVVTPVAVAAATGLLLGTSAALATFGSLSLERITGQQGAPQPVVPWWIVLAGVVLVAGALLVALGQWRRLLRRPLAELLRS